MRTTFNIIFSLTFIMSCIYISNAQQDTIYYDSGSGNYIIEYIGTYVYIQGLDGSLRLYEGEVLQDGEELVYIDSMVTVIFEPATKINPKIKCIVTDELQSNSFLYSYIVENGSDSQQKLHRFILEFGNVKVTNRTNQNGWINRRQKETHNGKLISVNRWAWSGRPGINPSFTYSDCALESPGLPGVMNVYFQGYTPILSFPTESPGGRLGSKIAELTVFPANHVKRKTIAPVEIPDPFDDDIFVDTLISYINQAKSLEWITNQSTTNKYLNYFQNVKTLVGNNNFSAAQTTLDSVLTDVEADSGVTLTSEAYALIKYNTEYLKDQLSQSHGFPHNVRLVTSQAQLLTEGTLQYYEGGWKPATNNGDGTFLVNTERTTISLRMTYEGGSETRQNVPIQGEVVTFQTINTQVELRNSQNQLMDEGMVKYYAGGWRDLGTTSGGVASKELLPRQYSFRMTCAYGSNDLQQDIGQNSTVVFQTVLANVELRNSQNQLMDEGIVQYYAGGWRDLGTTSGGVASKELLPKQYSFRMTYAYGSNDLQQDIGQNSTVVFQTVLANVELRNSQNQLMDEGTVKYYAGGWRNLGITAGGVATMELLPRQYSFRMTYAFASNDKRQDIGSNPVVQFNTRLATVQVTNSLNQPLNGAAVSYYAGGWRSLGNTENGQVTTELLLRNYSFRASYLSVSADKQQDISQNSVVDIQLNVQ
jgi:hypothetical protein